MTAERERLAAVLAEHVDWNVERLVDVLLPVVREFAAEELRAAADDWAQALPGLAAQLLARADALSPQ